jgi:hypothetical protein
MTQAKGDAKVRAAGCRDGTGSHFLTRTDSNLRAVRANVVGVTVECDLSHGDGNF